MVRILLILLAAVVAIILWNAGAATIGVVPLFLLCLIDSVGKGHARKISKLLQQYADSGDLSSPIYELPEQEAQSLLRAICTLTGTSLQKTRRDFIITLTAQTGFTGTWEAARRFSAPSHPRMGISLRCIPV